MFEKPSLTFGPFVVDPRTGEVRNGAALHKLTPKAVAVLQYLVDHAGQLVTKETLLQAVWPDTIVSDAALTVCIRELRQALHDNAKASQYIETVHRRGYRFIAP